MQQPAGSVDSGVKLLLVGGMTKGLVRQMVKHLRASGEALPFEIVPLTSPKVFGRRMAEADAATRGVFLGRNPIDHVLATRRKTGRSGEQVVRIWNAYVRQAEELAESDRFAALSYEDLFLRREGWDRLSAFLGVELAPPEGEAEEVGMAVHDEIVRSASLTQYRALVGALPGASAAGRSRVIRMYMEDVPALDYDYEDIGAQFAVRRTLGQPIPEEPDVTFLGSAAVFGRFVPSPFPSLVAEATGLSVANLGFGGARPEVYLDDPVLMRLIESSEVVVVELMAGRGYENDMFTPISPHYNGVVVKPAYRDQLQLGHVTGHVFVDHVWERAFAMLPTEEVQFLIQQSSRQLERDLARLLGRCRKSVLFHLAQQPLPAEIGAESYYFPHMVTRAMAERLSDGRPFCSVVSQRGIPSRILDQRTGAPAPLMPGRPDPTLNTYYPSPEMHAEAAAALQKVLRTL